MSQESETEFDLHQGIQEKTGLWGAAAIIFHQGLFRQTPIIIGLFIALLVESIGLAVFIPLLALGTEGPTANQTGIRLILSDFLGFFGIAQPTLIVMLSILMICSIIKCIAMTLAMSYAGFSVARFATDFRLRLIDKLLDARWLYFTSRSGAMISNAIVSETKAASRAYRSALLVFVRLGFALIYTALTFAINWQAGVGGTITALILGFGIFHLVVMSRRARREQIGAAQSIIRLFSELLINMKPLKAMNRYHHIAKGLSGEIKGLKRIARRLVLAQQIGAEMFQLSTMLILVIGFVVSTEILGLQFAEFILLALLVQRLMQSTSQYFLSLLSLELSSPSYWYIRRLEADVESAREEFVGKLDPNLGRGVEFEKVRFSYTRKAVLKEASLSIPEGKLTALIGDSGAGKTTLVDLILGLVAPKYGHIRVGQDNLWHINIIKWRRMVGYVGQELLLFNETIASNVTLNDPALSEDDVIHALKLAGAWEFVKNLPDGIHAHVGERGLMLSGGQRQRIALARALVHQPRLLILDEATSALDPETEKSICDTVFELVGQYTIVVITHRPAWLDRAHRIYRVENGMTTAVDPQMTGVL